MSETCKHPNNYVHTETAPAAGGGGSKDGNTGATAAALFPCLIYYPGM